LVLSIAGKGDGKKKLGAMFCREGYLFTP